MELRIQVQSSHPLAVVLSHICMRQKTLTDRQPAGIATSYANFVQHRLKLFLCLISEVQVFVSGRHSFAGDK